MKLANIKDPLDSNEVLRYALQHRLAAKEFSINKTDQFVDITKLINTCFNYAFTSGCKEVCLKEIKNRYNTNSDKYTWKVLVIGFSKTDKPIT